MILEDLLVLFVATPISFLLLRKYKQDKIAFAWIFPWTILLFIDKTGSELYFSLVLFSIGLIPGIITDIGSKLISKQGVSGGNICCVLIIPKVA